MEYGYSHEFTINVERPGKSGADEIQQMMKNFRSNPPKELGGSVIDICKDFQSLEITKAQRRRWICLTQAMSSSGSAQMELK